MIHILMHLLMYLDVNLSGATVYLLSLLFSSLVGLCARERLFLALTPAFLCYKTFTARDDDFLEAASDGQSQSSDSAVARGQNLIS